MTITKNAYDLNMRRLHHASAAGDLKTVRHLLYDLDVDPDSRDMNTETHRQTASERAAAKGHLNVLKELARAGADFFILSRSGMTLEDIVRKHIKDGEFATSRKEYEECLKFIIETKEEQSKLRGRLRMVGIRNG
ncbi:MAG TPA: hypothetical protein VND15_00570 [Candidatus Acidoferrales bacterium]|nr:hypothetical protein [Candidatus Acidoferrales bacterium]